MNRSDLFRLTIMADVLSSASFRQAEVVQWPVLSIADQARSAAAYQALLDAEAVARFQRGIGFMLEALAKRRHDRCMQAVELLRSRPDGMSESEIADAMGVTKDVVKSFARALVAEGAPYGVVRSARGADGSARRYRVI